MTNIKKHRISSNAHFRKEYKEIYTSQDHSRFLDTELHFQNDQFLKLINRRAIDLLQDDHLLPAKFIKVENGQLIVRVSKTRRIPRKGEYLTAVLLRDNMPDYRNWRLDSWLELRQRHQIAISEAICIWQKVADNPNFRIVGFRGVTVEFVEKLIKDCIIIFGPKEPPREYLINLKTLANSSYSSEHSKFLNFEYTPHTWKPTVFDDNRNFPNFVIRQLELTPFLIIQGPPGTGKTYKLAELLATLLEQGKKVLVTALTNRALIELTKKEHLKKPLELGLVSKSNLTIDEINEVPELQNKRQEGYEGSLTLSTFYICSNEATERTTPYYDYVIMDEASQALLPMFEATIRLGQKVVWIGDQNQLPPIVLSNEKEINHQKSTPLIQGMKTVCDVFNFPSFILNRTFRLSNRGAEFTSLFYTEKIESAKHIPNNYRYPSLDSNLQSLFHSEGGPTWLPIELSTSEASPINGILLISHLVEALHNYNKKLNIAVLTKLKKSVTQLQLAVNTAIGDTEKVLVDTVERVQGMTCDICIFFIPNTHLSMSLNPAFFNVATSRASRHTIIVADPDILNSPVCKGAVRLYLEKLDQENKVFQDKIQILDS